MIRIDLARDNGTGRADEFTAVNFDIDLEQLNPEQLELMREVAEPLRRLGEFAGVLYGLPSSEGARENMGLARDHFDWRYRMEAAKVLLGGEWPVGLSLVLPNEVESEEDLPVIDAIKMSRLSWQLTQMRRMGGRILEEVTEMHPKSVIESMDDVREYYGLDDASLAKAKAIVDSDRAAKASHIKETSVSPSYLNVLEKLGLGKPSSLDDARSIDLPSYDISSPVTLMDGEEQAIRQGDVTRTIMEALSVATLGVLRGSVGNAVQASINHTGLRVERLEERAESLTNKHFGTIEKVVLMQIPISETDMKELAKKGATEPSVARFRVHAVLKSTGKPIFISYFETTIYTAEEPDGKFRLVATTSKNDKTLTSETFHKLLLEESRAKKTVLDSNMTVVSGGLPTLGK